MSVRTVEPAVRPGSPQARDPSIAAGAIPRTGAVAASVSATRRADIDALRVVGIATVFLVHSAQVFSPFQHWHIQNSDRSEVLGLFTVLAWPWVMPLFMLLAGAAAWFSLGRRTGSAFLRDRTLRLLIPFILGTLLIVPPQVYVERLQQGRFDGSYLAFYPTFFRGLYPEGNFAAGHLWFLAYLYAYGLATGGLLRWLRGAGRAWLGRFDRLGTSTFQFLVLPAALLALGQIALRARFPESLRFFDDWANHALLLPAFLFGFALPACPRLESAINRAWRWVVVPAGASSLVLAYLIAASSEPGFLPSGYTTTYLLFWTLFALSGWWWTVVLLGVARHLVGAGNDALRRASRAVPMFYVLHQTVVAVAAYVVVGIDAAIPLKFGLLVAIALPITLLLTAGSRQLRGARYLAGARPG